MTAVLAPLEELPTTTTALVRATLHAQQGLLERSTARLLSATLSDSVWMVRKASLQLHFFIARSAEQVLFFFARRALPEVRPLSVQLAVTVEAAPQPTPTVISEATQRLSAPPIHLLTVPSCLVAQPSAQDFAQHAPPGTTAEDGILFRMGTDQRSYLGIRHPARGLSAQLCYHQEGHPATMLRGFPVAPFLDLAQSIRCALLEPDDASQALPIQLPHDPGALSDVHVSLFWLIEGFRLMEAGLMESSHAQASPFQQLAVRYEPSVYQAELALRLNQQGFFVSDPAVDAVSLGLRVCVLRERGSLLVRLTLVPPDFLVHGLLRDSFLQALKPSTPLLIRKQLGFLDDDAWSAFLDSAQDRAVIFRVERTRSADVNVVILSTASSRTEGSSRQIIVRCLAQVDAQASPPSVKLSDVALRYDSAQGTSQTLDDETARYFVRLASAFQIWLRVLNQSNE